MTVDRDPNLQNLFDVANQDVPEQPFVADVMSQVDGTRRKAAIAWICVGLVLIACFGLLAAPLRDAVQLLTQAMSISLVDLGDRWLARIISPANSVAGLVALGLLGLRAAYRRIFS